MSYQHFFLKTLGVTPYSYQQKAVDLLLDGKNVIISAPTGAGKTWAALMPYFYSRYQGSPFVDRVLYALPLRSLATNLFESTKNKRLQNEEIKKFFNDINISIQTGERKEDPFWTSDICFMTIDQLLSGYLNIPLSLPSKLGNINAGALIGSLVIFDEIHLLDPQNSFKTVIEMGKRLENTTQFLLMTATLTDKSLQLLANHFNAVVVRVGEEDLKEMPSHNNKKRKFIKNEKVLSSEAVLEHHRGGRTIVLCNTVQRAQEIFTELKEKSSAKTKKLLLHSRFYKEDRLETEKQLAEYFGPEAEKTDVILVSTQVIEAGLDISADNLHTELCPANSLIQRAGRCARYADRNSGTVWIYDLPQNDKNEKNYNPYLEEECTATWNKLSLEKFNDAYLNFNDESELINLVHGNESRNISKICNVIHDITEMVNQTIRDNDRSKIDELIRDIQSVGVIICSDPKEVDPLKLETISVSPKQLLKVYKNASAVGARLFIPEEDNEAWRWRMVTNTQELIGAWIISLPPQVASYSSETGLCLDRGGEEPALKIRNLPPIEPYHYEFETYREHALATFKEMNKLIEKASNAINRISISLKISEDLIKKLLYLTSILHDTGKLTARWATAINNWQDDYYPNERKNNEPMAHSTFRPENGDNKRQKDKRYQRGGHAIEGAMAIYVPIHEVLKGEENYIIEICNAIFSAIACHHGLRWENFKVEPFELIPAALNLINEILAECMHERINTLFDYKNFTGQDLVKLKDDVLLKPDQKSSFLLYWYLVRLLRLADQEAVKKLSEKGGENI